MAGNGVAMVVVNGQEQSLDLCRISYGCVVIVLGDRR